MSSEVQFNRKTHVTALLIAVILFVSFPVHASFYNGGDWGGKDLSLLDGDSISGYFSNVAQFYIPVGVVISGSTDNLTVNAGNIIINGGLFGLPTPGYDLNLSSLTTISLNGSLGSWKSISLSANSLLLNGTITVIDGSSISPPQPIQVLPGGSQIILKGGDLSIVSTPLPAAAWLLGSGLLGLAGVRRKRK